MNETNFAIRTVQEGRVKVGGVCFKVDELHLTYDGRLDGLRFAFARYKHFIHGGPYLPFISLWGPEAQWHDHKCPRGPEVVDGALPWMWWRAEVTKD